MSAEDTRKLVADLVHTCNCCISGSLGKRRKFGAWSMGFAYADGAAQILKGFVDVDEDLDLKRIDEARALEVLSAVSAKPSVISA